jgi:hypothetical protein
MHHHDCPDAVRVNYRPLRKFLIYKRVVGGAAKLPVFCIHPAYDCSTMD